MTAALQQVHLRFNDAAGKPLPCRIRITDSAGTYYAPLGRLTRFATEPGIDVGANVCLDGDAWALIDGTCEIALPPGPLKVQARKGPEYRPLDVDVDLHLGKMSLRFALERWTNRATDGWYSGDTCSYELPPHAALLEALAQDLNVTDLLVRERPAARLLRSSRAAEPAETNSLANITAYSGQHPALASANHLVVVNTANQSPFGRLLLLNTHRVVYPLSFQLGEKWSLLDWCDQCHRKKGLVVADDWLIRLADGPTPELLDADFLNRVDAIRFHPDVSLAPWWDALRRGFRLPLVAGSGKESNRELLGSWRTYAKLSAGEDFTYAAWTEAVRRGDTFVTNGPLLSWTRRETMCIEAMGADRLELLENGEVIDETSIQPLRLECPAGKSIVARCTGRRGGFALSSAVMV